MLVKGAYYQAQTHSMLITVFHPSQTTVPSIALFFKTVSQRGRTNFPSQTLEIVSAGSLTYWSCDLFHQVTEDRVQQMERENSFILRWNDKKDTTVSPSCQNLNRKQRVTLGLSHSNLRAQQTPCVPFLFFLLNIVRKEGTP